MKSFKLSLVVVMALVTLCTATAQANVQTTRLWQQSDMKISTPEMRQRADWGLAGYSQKLRQQKMLAEMGVSADILVADDYSVLVGPNGEDWIYTAKYTWGKELLNQITNATFTIYDATLKQVGTISIDIDTTNNRVVNELTLYGVVTNKFFDFNERTYEVTIYEHEVYAEGVHGDRTHIYNTKGERITTFEGAVNLAIFTVQRTSYDSYSRLLQYTMAATNADGVVGHQVDIYKPVSYANPDQPVLEKSFFIPEELIHTHVGTIFNTYTIDGRAYYTFSHYEKPFYSGPVNMENGEQPETQDNYFIVTVLDEKLDTVAGIRIPCEKPEKVCRMYGFGFLSNGDLSKGKFSGDDDFNFLISIDNDDLMANEDKFDFEVYNSKSEKIKTIDTNVDAEGILKLNDIKGFEEQYAFGHTEKGESDKATSYIKLVNVPSCEVAATITPTTDMPLSFSMNRYPNGKDYQYVIEYSQPEVDADDNLLIPVGWFNSDLSLSHTVKFNLGNNGLMARFYLSSVTLNPFLLDLDAEHEYVYFLNAEREDDNRIDIYLIIADHEGNTIKSYVGDDEKGTIMQVCFLNPTTLNKTLVIVYWDQYKTGKLAFEFIPLPFDGSLKGSGTAEDPYQIATQGDLERIPLKLGAHYLQVADIDFGLTDKAWNAISGFRGVYDGGNHIISNLYIENTSADYLSLFGDVSEATLKNIIINNPTIEVGPNNGYAATLVGNAIQTKISNVHVYNALIHSQETKATIGGIASDISFESSVEQCSFANSTIDVAGGYQVGGIAGNAGTGTLFNTNFVSGSISGDETIGGIVGSQGTDVKITNSHVDATIIGNSTIGGIAGYADRAPITNNLVEGALIGKAGGRGGNYMGGLVGYLAEDWQGKSSKIITNNVLILDSIASATADDKTVHGIAGHTSENEINESTGKPYPEVGLSNNYINLSAWATAHDNVGGGLVAADTLDQAFFESLGFAYGESVDAPWVNSTLPQLFTESLNDLEGITLVETELTVRVNDTYQLHVEFLPTYAELPALAWASSDETVATVDADGVITALAQGETTITVSAEGTTFSATCVVNVIDPTGLDNVGVNTEIRVRKVLINGTIYIIRNNEWYTIDGLRVK